MKDSLALYNDRLLRNSQIQELKQSKCTEMSLPV